MLEIKITKRAWKCETCGNVFEEFKDVMLCEEHHIKKNCKHENSHYDMTYGDLGVEIRCDDCDKQIIWVDFEELDGRVTQEDLKILFKIARKYEDE